MRPSKLWLGLGAILALALIGCAATMHEAEPGKPLALGEDTALVFGRIAVAENSRPVALGGIFELPAEANIIHLDGVAEDISVSLEDDGGFYLVVPRGTYLVTAVAGRFDPKTAFRVPPRAQNDGADAYYLGALRLDVGGEDALIGRRYVLTGVRLDDEFEPARETLAKRYPDFAGSVDKSLMVHSDEIPEAAQARRELQQREQRRVLLNTIGSVLRSLTTH